ncbi:IS1182 family transposase [Paracoccus shanxieyensis]|uniref:IS1182 family transposase n=2 Tax=Paracoccaceae TaxID=31989 RepID=A0A6L6J7V8_9RHOB|nr:IS1182 family transposase [Paracoccus shanxieyensis]MTH66734.1 IS1182 family transposase [Paracoccus shanxieyensis]MTH89970.1 IS1182 family transposase [Paracoccus shanxieyensis]
MMGSRQVAQGALFYEFSLEDHVPQDHLIRAIDRFVDLDGIRQHLAPFYSSTGRPSVDPELMIRMLLIGYCFGIRSERRICEEVHLNLAYRWFCRLDLNTAVPDHSTFSKNRHGRFRDSDLLREVFETVVRRCITEGLVGGRDFATDASLIRADAGKMYSMSQEFWQGGQIDEETAPRAVREYLETLDEAAFGAASEVRPKFVSCSDPASQWTAAMNAPAIFAYSTNYLIDTDNAVIVDVEASRSIRQAEVGATRTMIDRANDRFDLQPERLAADTAYGSAEMLAWLDERQITQHIPVFDKTERADGTFPNTAFSFDPVADEYTCPGGRKLKKYWRDIGKERPAYGPDGFRRYYASKADCGTCELKARCTPNQDIRRISRHRHEAVRDKVRAFAGTDAYLESTRRRKKVEMLFAHLKRILRLGRLRLRGPNGAKDEFLLAATAQNLRKLAKLIPGGPQTA